MQTKIPLAVLSGALLAGCATPPQKSVFTEMTCDQHEVVALSFNTDAVKVFDAGYAHSDPALASAQLQRIKNGAHDKDSVKINNAEIGYNDNLNAANGSGCDTSDYPIGPIGEFQKRSDVLAAPNKKP